MTPLHAGPLRMELDGADLRYVCLGQHEVVRRLYVAVRDPHWNTVPPDLSDLVVERGPDTFRVTFTCAHRQDGLDFAWQGTIAGDADGTIRYTMAGQARSTFERARIGICVLHPIETCAGAPFRVTHPDGTLEDGVLPRLISPHQPVMDIAELAHPVGSDGWATLQFEGDVFEMEDQRNWTDASFKSYSTPLRLPIPVRVERGTRIDQSVTLRVRPSAGWSRPDVPEEPVLVVGQPSDRRLPAIGLGLGALPLGPSARQHLRALNLAHVRLDLHQAAADDLATLRQAAEAARPLGAPLEIALTLGETPADWLDGLRSRLEELDLQVARWLIFAAGQPSTPTALVRLARERLAGTAAFGGGSDTQFTELNRNRPSVDGWDVVCYPIMPQAHAFDELSIVETLAGQAETVASARAFVGDTPLAITPITLRRRPRPGESAARWPATDWRSSDDPRQATDFASAWTLGSLATLAESGVASATYFEATGARGVMTAEGEVYPDYHVFAAIADRAGATVLPMASSQPLRVRGLGLQDGARTRVLVANMTAEPLVARLRGLPAGALARPVGTSAAEQQRASASGELELRLAPFGLVRVDAEA